MTAECPHFRVRRRVSLLGCSSDGVTPNARYGVHSRSVPLFLRFSCRQIPEVGAVCGKAARTGSVRGAHSNMCPYRDPYYVREAFHRREQRATLALREQSGKADWAIAEIKSLSKKFEDASIEANELFHKHLAHRR
jgi:hypothetical protein